MTVIDTDRQPMVAAFGEWSGTNIGDHAIHEGVQAFFDECGWRVRSFDLGALRPASGARPGITTPPIERRTRPTRTLDTMPATKRALRGWRQPFLIKRLLPALARCDAICVGGGALLTDVNLHFPQSLEALTGALRQLRKPVLCLGCSTEDDWSPQGRQMVHDFLSNCGVVAVRDHASAARVSHLLGRNVPVFGDFALRMASLRNAPRQRMAPTYLIAVNVTHVPAPYTAWQQRYEDGLVEIVANTIERTPGGVAIFTTGTAEDVAPAIRVWQRLASRGAELRLGQSLAQVREVLNSSRATIAARLHAAIISLAEQVPVLGYAATPKVGNFFESIGLRSCYFGPNDPVVAAVNQLSQLMSTHEQLTVPAYSLFEDTRQRAREFLWALTPTARPLEAVSL